MARMRPIVRQLQQDLAEPIDFSCPTVVVSTVSGYRPTVDEIAATINDGYGLPTIHDLDKAGHTS